MTTSTPRDNPPGKSEAPSTQPETASQSSDFANYQAASSRSTLKTDEYFKRLESAQSAIGKSLLALLALVAFWLSIENSYYKYVRLEAEQTNQAKLAGVRGSILEALKDNGLVTTQRLSTLGASFGMAGSGKATASLDLGNDSVDDFCSNPPPLLTTDALRSVKRQCKEFADNKARLDRIEERIVKLQEEPLDLSILGTKIPSRLAVAAEVWLIALLIWISYFEAKRSAAHCNLAALHLGMSLEERAFGTIPGGSFWLSPVPTSLRVLFSDGTTKVTTDSDLRYLLGWTEEAENRQVCVLRWIMVVLFLAVARLGYIALDLTTDMAAASKFIAVSWQLPLTATALTLVTLSWFRIIRLARRRSVVIDGSDLPVLNRRIVILDLLCLSGAMMAAPFLRPKAFESIRTSLPGTKKAGSNPRFIQNAKRVSRRINHNVVIKAKPALTLVYSASKRVMSEEPSSNTSRASSLKAKPRSVVTVHVIDEQENLRLLNPVRGNPKWTPLTLEDLDKRIDANSSLNGIRLHPRRAFSTESFSLNTAQTWPFEVLAVGQIAAGQLDVACDVLMRGARLTLLREPGKPVNLRVLDLLAGLAVRTGQENKYLKPLVSYVEAHIARFNALTPGQQERYVTKHRRPRHHCSSPSAKDARKKPPVEPAASSSAVASQAAKPAELVTSIHELTKRLNKWKGVFDQRQDKRGWWSHWSDQSKPVAWHHPLKVTTVPRARSGCRQSTGKQQVTIQIPIFKPLDIRG